MKAQRDIEKLKAHIDDAIKQLAIMSPSMSLEELIELYPAMLSLTSALECVKKQMGKETRKQDDIG